MKRRLALWARIRSMQLVYAIASVRPVQPKVILATSHIPAIRGNLAAIGDEIQRRDSTIAVTRLIHARESGLFGVLRALVNDCQAIYHLATAVLFITDSHYVPIYVIKRRPGTAIVQVWHACGAIKKIGYSVLGKSFGTDSVTADAIRIHSNYDLCLAGSQAAVVQYMDAFRQPASLFRTDLGIPRTDVLIAEAGRDALIAAIRQRYAIPARRRVVLYAPTFRGASMTKAKYPGNLDLAAMAEALGKDHVILLRLHPAIRAGLELDPSLAGFVIDVSDWPEINELMLVSDVLVTDYSSVVFEFALLGRPMAFFAPDTAEYDDERGFYFDYRTGVPGPVFETTSELAAYLRAGEFDLDRVRAFATTWFEVADGHASERFFDQVVVPALEGRPITGHVPR